MKKKKTWNLSGNAGGSVVRHKFILLIDCFMVHNDFDEDVRWSDQRRDDQSKRWMVDSCKNFFYICVGFRSGVGLMTIFRGLKIPIYDSAFLCEDAGWSFFVLLGIV